MALMRLVHDWTGTQSSPPLLTVLTVDHGLRDGSAAEALQVARWAEALLLPHVILRWEGEKPQTGLQAAARRARYGLMAQWCRDNGAAMLLTGHTRDDQAETVLMRLRRTLSPDSLAGIPPRGQWNGLPELRPLLATGRAELRGWLDAIGQAWIDDPSNDNPRFERVRIREELRFAGSLTDRLVRLADLARAVSTQLDRASARWLSHNLTEYDSGYGQAPRQSFLALPEALQRRLLQRLVSHFGGGGHTPEAAELARLARWAEEGPVRATLAGAILGRRRDTFWITREAERIVPEPLVIGAEGRAVWDRRFVIVAPEGSEVVADAQGRASGDAAAPAAARRAYPLIRLPEGVGGPVKVVALRLSQS